MGTSCLVVVVGGPRGILDALVSRVEILEAAWSRFDPASEVSKLNGASGCEPLEVSSHTILLVSRSVDAWRLTHGRFDPTVGAALVAAGYDATFESLPWDRPATAGSDPLPTPGCGGIAIDSDAATVRIPAGVRFDPGGLGKGLAADLVAAEGMVMGARGVLVDLGGDIRVAGQGPDDGLWVLDVEHPFEADRPLLHLAVRDAALATSTRQRRRWLIDGDPRHHIIDPATGSPTSNRVVSATVIASEGWIAEAQTKAVIVAGRLDAVTGMSALLVDEAGRCEATPELAELIGTAA